MTAGDAGILAPVNSGVVLTVSHGYNDPLPGEACQIGSERDHCTNQRFGLDLVPDRSGDRDILAPVPGRVAWLDEPVNGWSCLGLTIDDGNLNMNICHFTNFAVRRDQRVERGQLLGARGTPHIHLSLDDRYNSRPRPPVPFTGRYTIDGQSFDALGDRDRNYHVGRTIVSTNHRPGETVPTFSPTPVPVLPSPTPVPATPTSVAPPTALPTTPPTHQSCAAPVPPGSGSASRNVCVEGRSEVWTRTGLIVRRGETLWISAPGRWCWAGTDYCSTADGTTNRPNRDERAAAAFPDGHLGQLYGRIANWVFPAGSQAARPTEADGELELVMNDRVGNYGDNTGALLIQVGTGSPPPPAPPQSCAPLAPPGAVCVDSRSDAWTRTPIYVRQGESFWISASGRWCWGGTDYCSTADGSPDRPNSEERSTAKFPSGQFGQLFGRIGGWVFPVGSQVVDRAQADGEIELLMNDRIANYGDNSGTLMVQAGTGSPAPGTPQPSARLLEIRWSGAPVCADGREPTWTPVFQLWGFAPNANARALINAGAGEWGNCTGQKGTTASMASGDPGAEFSLNPDGSYTYANASFQGIFGAFEACFVDASSGRACVRFSVSAPRGQVATPTTTVSVTPASRPAALTPTPLVPTPVPGDTPPGSVLRFGQTWYQDGIKVTVSDPTFGADLHFDGSFFNGCTTFLRFVVTIENTTGQDLVATADTKDWYWTDDRGRKNGVMAANKYSECQGLGFNLLPQRRPIVWTLYAIGDLKNMVSVGWVRLVIPNLSRVKNAAWQVDVPH